MFRSFLFSMSVFALACSAYAATLPARPAVNATWHIQLDGTPKTPDVQVFDIDLFDTPASRIASLKSSGKFVICYFSAGSFEDWRPDKAQFPAAAIGKPLDGWDGENWLDIRNAQVVAIMKARMDLAAQKGCSAVDFDNVDSYTQDSGFSITKANNIAFLKTLADYAHSKGMLTFLKNAMGMAPDLINHYDGAVNESCLKYNECNTYAPFKNAGKPVFAIDYTAYSANKCSKAKNNGLNMMFYKRALKQIGTPCPPI